MKYAAETRTLNKMLLKRIEASEYWCYRHTLKISWIDKITNENVLIKMTGAKLHFVENFCATKIGICCVPRDSSGREKGVLG